MGKEILTRDDIVRIAIESVPQAGKDWTEYFSALLTPIIAILALYIAYQQHKINKQRLKHELYERRLEVFKAVKVFLSEIVQKGNVSFDRCLQFNSETSDAAFLFDDSTRAYIDKIYEKACHLGSVNEELSIGQGSPNCPEKERRGKLVADRKELFLWIANQLKKSEELFGKNIRVS